VTRLAGPSPDASGPVVTGPATPSPTASAPPTDAPSPGPTASSQGERARGDIPWAEVGAGWSAVGRATTPTGPVTVLLVSPQGTRYVVATGVSGSVRDVSPDGRRILVTSTDRVAVVEAATGRTRTVPTAGGPVAGARFTRPTGAAVLVDVVLDGRRSTVRVAADGEGTLTARGTFAAQSSPTGVFIAGSTTDPAGPVVVLDNATGRRLLTVTVPKGYDTCRLVRWWSSTEVLVTCDAASLRRADLFRVTAPSGARSALTRAPASGPGYEDALRVGSTTVVKQWSPDCGGGRVGTLDGDRAGDQALRGLGTDAAAPLLAGTWAGGVVLWKGGCTDAGGTASLTAYDLERGTEWVLVPAGPEGSVTSVAVLAP
jgi:hypothetical protein